MRRLLLSLYAVVAAALIGFLVVIPWLLTDVLRSELLRGTEKTTMAAQLLFEEQLRNVPIGQWPAHVEELKAKFGYDLALLRLDEIATSDRNIRRMRQGLVALPDGDRFEFMLLPIRGSDYVIQTYLIQRDQEKARRTMAGFYYLIEKQLARYDSRSTDALSEIKKRTDVPLQRVALSDIVSKSDRDRLLSGDIVGHDIEGPDETYFKYLTGTDEVLQVGPFERYFLEKSVDYIAWAALAIIVALALYLWARPLWRDMLALDQGALALGRGQFDFRVQVSPRSRVAALASTFNGMAGRVQALLKAQKEMTDAVSHELRTPISRLRFSAEMLGYTKTDDHYRRYMDGILRDIDELDELVDEALTYSRLTNSAACLSMQEVDLADWLQQIVEDTQRSAGATTVSSRITTASATANFDARLMARAVSNIVRNCVRYAQTAVKITINDSAGALEIIIEDDGPGIPPDQRQAVFEPFHRVDSSRQRESGGHGLGLAIVKRICEWHRAEVTAAESPSGGALFRLHLPTARSEQAISPTRVE